MQRGRSNKPKHIQSRTSKRRHDLLKTLGPTARMVHEALTNPEEVGTSVRKMFSEAMSVRAKDFLNAEARTDNPVVDGLAIVLTTHPSSLFDGQRQCQTIARSRRYRKTSVKNRPPESFVEQLSSAISYLEKHEPQIFKTFMLMSKQLKMRPENLLRAQVHEYFHDRHTTAGV